MLPAAQSRCDMATTTMQRTPAELARLGEEMFDRRVRPGLRPEDDGRFVAIDVDSGEYEIDDDDYSAVMRLKARVPSADVWLARAGSPTTYRIGCGR
jgi:hypothetical protein